MTPQIQLAKLKIANLADEKCLVLNTGVPQGCVLSPVLFSAEPNNASFQGVVFYMYGHDTALVARVAWLDVVQRSQLWLTEKRKKLL